MATPLAPEKPSCDTFGGTFSDASSVVDPSTELAASYFNNLVAQLVAVSMTAPIAWARVTISGGTETLADHSAVWGDTAGVAPTPSKTATGDYTLTWASSYNDLRESPETPESHAVSIRCVQVSAQAASGISLSPRYVHTANTVRVRFYDKTDTLTDPAEFCVTVW